MRSLDNKRVAAVKRPIENLAVDECVEFRITSAVPGRVRLKLVHCMPKGLDRLARQLRSICPGAQTEIRPDASSITLTYPSGHGNLDDIVRAVERTTARLTRTPARSHIRKHELSEWRTAKPGSTGQTEMMHA